MIRYPSAAGTFYPADDSLKDILKEFTGKLDEEGKTRRITAVVVPHAGYVFSGRTAARAYRAVYEDGLPETFVVIGPNHTGMGSPIAIYPEGEWITPLGEIRIDSELAKEIAKLSGIADLDEMAHEYEHSVEVQVPFIQHIADAAGRDVRIVPIVLGIQDEEVSNNLGRSIFEAGEELGRDIVVVASSDFMHYGSVYGYVPFKGRADELPNMVREWDFRVIRRILDFDVEGMFNELRKMGHTMCGPGAVGAAVVYSKLSGATEAELLHYATSYEVSHSSDAIVGYAAIAFRR